MQHLCTGCLGGDARIIGQHGVGQGDLVVQHAELPQGAAALARFAQADDALQRVVGATGGSQQRVAGAQQAEQRHRNGVGAAHELGTDQGVLGPHGPAEHLLQLVAAVVPDAVAGGPPKVPRLHAAVGKGAQHFQLVVIPDALGGGKLVGAQAHGLLVQGQHLRFDVVKLFDHGHLLSFFYFPYR